LAESLIPQLATALKNNIADPEQVRLVCLHELPLGLLRIFDRGTVATVKKRASQY
jgi:hypothetical protein